VHHWPDIRKGLHELRRVTRNQVLIMTFDPDALNDFWNAHYFPEVIEIEKSRYPTIDFITEALGGSSEVQSIPLRGDCVDEFQEACYGRPGAFHEKEIRSSQSAGGFVSDELEEKLVKVLADELQSGEWDKRDGIYRQMSSYTCALRLLIATP